MNDREVYLPRGFRSDLFGEIDVRTIVFRRHHHSRRVFIEPMHDARAQHAVDPRQVPAVIQQRIDERPAHYPVRRMHRHATRLVVKHRERYRFRLNLECRQLAVLD